MKITLTSTTKLVTLDGVVLARVWEGETDSGIPVHAFITRLAVERAQDTTEFDREIQEHAAPSMDVQAYPTRLIL